MIAAGVLLVRLDAAHAAYRQRFEAFAGGAITFTGNTLGLAKATGQNLPGPAHSIGTFITTDPSSRDGFAMACSNAGATPCTTNAECAAPGTCVAGWPLGTTADWRASRSSAELRLPAGAQVLRAELVWSGSFGETVGEENVLPFLDAPATLVTPLGVTLTLPPDPASSQNTGSVNASGRCTGACFYTRSADVTAAVQAAGPGTYTAGGIPATQSTREDTSNAAGWTLAVVYGAPGLPVRNLTLFTAAERSGAPPAQVSGFCTPPTGTPSGRLMTSAIEGDANQTGDQMLFGPSATLGAADRLSGPRNTATNFFASQITDDAGNLDVAGSFGTINHNPPHQVSGARQGYDIVNVDVSMRLVPGQTTAFAQGTTTGESYYINMLGLQIDVGAPRFVNPSLTVDKATATVGDVLTYTLVLDNQGTAPAEGVVVFDTPPPGTTFVPGSVTIAGVAVGGADPTQPTGVPLAPTVPGGTIAPGSSVTVTYQVQVTAIPAPPAVASWDNDVRWTFDWIQCAGLPGESIDITSNVVTTRTPRIEAVKEVAPTTIVPGQATTFTITVRNTGTATAIGATLDDLIPAGMTYVPFSHSYNLVSSGISGPLPGFIGPLPDIAAGDSGVLSFQVTADAGASGTITNVATVDPDGPGPLPPFDVTAPIQVTPVADLVIAKAGPDTVLAGSPVSYTLTVQNTGPSSAQNVVLDDPAPANTTFVLATAPCVGGFPCALGTLAAGASVTVSVTYDVAAGLPAGTIIRNTATVTSPTDPVPANNTATAETAINAPVVNLSVTKTDGVSTVVPGTPVTYTIVVTNAPGSDTADGARVLDAFPPAAGTVTWTCSPAASCVPASGTGSIDTLVTLAGGAAATVTATAQTDPAALGQLVNTVTVAAPPNVGNPRSASATDTDQITPQADVRATKTGPATLLPGGTVGYEIVVTNAGPSAATDVAIDDPVPDGLTLQGTPAGCPSGFPCELGTLAPGETRTITATYMVAADAPASVTNRALVSTSTADPDLTNNTPALTSTVSRDADVFVTKSGPTQAPPGATATYVITVGNRGPAVATGVVVSDPTPAGLTVVSTGGGPCAPDPPGSAAPFPCSVGDVPPGASRTVTVTYRLPPGLPATSPVENTASATSPTTTDPVPGNNSATARTQVPPASALALEKSVTPTSLVVGGTATYTVRVRNGGPSDAAGIVVADAIPAQLTLRSATPSAGTYDAATGAWTVGALPAGAQATLTTVVTVNAPGRIANQAVQTGGGKSPRARSQTSAGAFINATASADLGVDIAVDNETPAPNDFLTFTVTVTNQGPSDSTGAAVATRFVCDPGGVPVPIALSMPPAGTTYDGETWVIGTLPVGQATVLVATIDLTQAPEDCVTLRNQPVVRGAEPDPNPANDIDSAIVTPVRAAVGPLPPPPPADIQITKGVSNETPEVGEAITYIVTARNNGPGSADGAIVLEPLPDGLTLLPASENPVQPSKGTWDAATGEWTIGSLAANESASLALSVVVARAGTIANLVVLSTPKDANPDNDMAGRVIEVGAAPAADLSITKTASPSEVLVGRQVTWTLAVSNAGPEPATDVVVTDVVPAQVQVDSMTPSQGTCSMAGGQVTCRLGDVAVGSGATVILVATRTAEQAFTNAAAVGASQLDPDPSNNTARVSTAAAGSEDCFNCQDDDGDGLVDLEDSDCCNATPLTVTSARYRTPQSRLRVTGTIAGAPFAGLDPRRQEVHLQVRNADGSLVCCTLPTQRWQRLFGKTWGFFDQKMRACPDVRCVKLAVPASGDQRTTIVLGRTPASAVASPLQITLGAGGQCVQGSATLTPAKRGAVFP